MKLYCVYDFATEKAGSVFESPTDNSALREFFTKLSGHPNKDDFRLICLGVFYNDDPHIKAEKKPYDVINSVNNRVVKKYERRFEDEKAIQEALKEKNRDIASSKHDI